MNSLQSIVETLAGELGVNVCSLYQLADCDSLELTASYGLSQSAIGAKIHINQGLTGRVARTRRSLSVKNPSEHPEYFHLSKSGEERYQSYLGIPLITQGELHGVLVVQTIRPKMFFLNEIQTLYEAGRKLIEVLNNSNLKLAV